MADFEGTKEMNLDENIGLGELGRLRLENRDLQLAREKLFKKLDKKKNELENEKTHTITLRQFIQELNRKVELLERDKERQSMPVIRPLRIDPRPGLTGEVVERLVIEKTGLESNLEKQKTEIETLKSEITSMNTRIVLTDQKLEIARGEIDHFEKLVPELRLQLSRMENECKRMSMFTYSDDKTIETETLKTRIQDLSITNKHYLSQLQKKDLTIAKSTNRFETEKQQILERSRLEIEKLKQNETSLSEQLISANAELEELYRHSQDKKKTDQDILTLSTDNSQLLQQIACLEGDNAKLQDEFDRKPSKQELIAQLDDTQNKVTELLRKCNSLQKTKNEIEDTLQTELKESRDEVILLKTETNQQKETIDEQNEVIETYKQRQISEEEYKASETKDRLMSRYHYSFQSPASLPTHSIGSNTKPPVIEQPWKCLFCGDSYPSERERDIHMTDSCNNAPTRDDQSIVTQHRPPMGRPPMMKAHTFNAPNAPNFHHPMQQQGYLYHMSNRPLFQQQDRHLMRPSSLQTLEGFPRQSHQGAFSSQRTHRPHMARGLSVTQEEASGIPVSKVQSPLNMATEATKVILLWSKERPTLERELTYFDNSQDVVNLIWTDEQLLYQGNGTLAVGKHHGSLLFPSSGDMVQVQPFEVVRKPMGMFQVKLKLNDPQAQENVKVENRDTDQADRNSGQMDILRAEIQELTVNNNNIKSEKEKCKHELAKLDNQIIELMTELSSIRVYGREEEVKLSQEIEELKNEIHTLRTTSGHNSQGAGESNERVGVLEVTIAELKGKETENKLKIKDLRNENDSFEKENSDLKSEKMILKEQNIDLKESNLMYGKQIEELIKKQQQQPDGDANMELTSQLEAAKQQELNNETEIRELKQQQDKNLILLQQKEETITTTTNELEQTKQNESSLNEQLISANAELEELYRHSQDNEKTDQEILTLSTDNSQLLQQIACLEGDNAKLKEEFDRKPSKQELIAQLDDTQNKVTELLRKCNSLQKTKNEIEDTLQTELKESRDEVFLLKTETNRQKETIDKQNEVIETYKQQQITEEEYKASETKDKQISHLKMVNLELEAIRKTCDTHILELNEELQQSKSDYKDLDDLRKQFELESADKCSALEDDKSVLEIQVDVLNGQIGELSEERERCKGRVVGLETTLTDLQLQLRKLGEVQQNETATVQKYEQQITELTNQITILNNELTSVKESASISKQLINKLNQDIEVLETNNKQTIVEFQTKSTQSKRDREDLERKLGEMIRELADRDSRIQELSKPVVIPPSRVQVPKSPSTPVMPTNPKLKEEDKSLIRGKDSKSKETSAGATSGATSMDLTPKLITQANKTRKSPSKMTFRGVNINVVKLKAFPNPTESYNKQVICPINKHYELGVLMCIIDLGIKVGIQRATAKYAGIKLYSPVGNCDGAYKDKRYFECSPNCGIFVPLEDVYVPVP